jgi:hypothetical protein
MLTMFTLYQLNGSLRIEIESGSAGQPVKKSQQQHSSIPSPEPNAKWKGFGSPSPVQSQTTSPSLSGSSRRHSHQRSPGSQGVISFSARYPTANAEVLQAQLDKALGDGQENEKSALIEAVAAAERTVPNDEAEREMGRNAMSTPASRSRSNRSVRFSPKLEYVSHSETDSSMHEFDVEENSFSREMRSLRNLERDLSKSRSESASSSPAPRQVQEPTIDLSVLESGGDQEVQRAAVGDISSSRGGTPRPPGYFTSPSKSHESFSSHFLLRPKRTSGLATVVPATTEEQLEDATGNGSDLSQEDDHVADYDTTQPPPRVSTPPLSAHSSFVSENRLRVQPPRPFEDARPPKPLKSEPEAQFGNLQKTVVQLDDALKRLCVSRKVDLPQTPINSRRAEPAPEVFLSAAKALREFESTEKARAASNKLESELDHISQLRQELFAQSAAYRDRALSKLHTKSVWPQQRSQICIIIALMLLTWWLVEFRIQATILSLHESTISPLAQDALLHAGSTLSLRSSWKSFSDSSHPSFRHATPLLRAFSAMVLRVSPHETPEASVYQRFLSSVSSRPALI